MDQFSTPGHSMMKTLIMMSGEFDYGDIFFPEVGEDGVKVTGLNLMMSFQMNSQVQHEELRQEL